MDNGSKQRFYTLEFKENLSSSLKTILLKVATNTGLEVIIFYIFEIYLKSNKLTSSVAAHVFHPSTREAESGESLWI